MPPCADREQDQLRPTPDLDTPSVAVGQHVRGSDLAEMDDDIGRPETRGRNRPEPVGRYRQQAERGQKKAVDQEDAS